MWLRTYPPLWDDDSSPVSSEASWLATHSRVPRSASKVSMCWHAQKATRYRYLSGTWYTGNLPDGPYVYSGRILHIPGIITI